MLCYVMQLAPPTQVIDGPSGGGAGNTAAAVAVEFCARRTSKCVCVYASSKVKKRTLIKWKSKQLGDNKRGGGDGNGLRRIELDVVVVQ